MFIRKSDMADLNTLLQNHADLWNQNYILPGTLLM